MDNESDIIPPLLEKAEQYGKLSFELLKLKYLEKMANILSTLIAKMWLVALFGLFALLLNMALAFWLGSLLGAVHYGFFAMTLLYAFIFIIALLIQKTLKSHLNESIIRQIFKDDSK